MTAPASRLAALRPRARIALGVLGALTLTAAGGASPVRAQVFDVQNLLLLACPAAVPGSALETRCLESAGGNLSADSDVSLAPSQFLSAHAVAIERGKARTREILQGLEDRRDAEAGRFSPPAEPAEGEARADTTRLAVTAGGRATWFDRSAGVQERGFDGTTHSAQVVGDTRLAPGAFLGGFVSYDRTDSEFDPDQPLGAFPPVPSHSGKLDTNTASFGVFGSYNLTHAIYLDASLGYGFSYYEVERDAVFQNAARTTSTGVETRAHPDGEELTASARLGYEIQRGQLSFGPYGFANYIRSDLEGWSESDRSGSGLAMNVEGTTRESLTTVVGARWSYAIATPLGPLVPQGRFEWEHEFLQFDRNQTTTLELDTSASQLTLTADAPDRSHLNLGAGLLLALPGRWTPFLDYQGLVGDPELSQHRFTFGVRVAL